MEMVIFEENKAWVLEALEDGEFDYIDAASEYFETEFFRFIKAQKILLSLAQTYPTPRKKHDVPLWCYIASNLSMRLHGVHAFHAYPMIVRVGGMLTAFGPPSGTRVTHPDTGEVTISCEGFNHKNSYDRETPCDHDYLRKMAKDTDAEALMNWFGDEVVLEFHRQKAFDKEGIFIGDGSYLFVPDNPAYEGSVTLLFDANNHPISREAYEHMRDEQKAECQWRRCYKIVTLMHTRRDLDFFLFVGCTVVSGKDHECPLLYSLVDTFVEVVGKGVMKRLILDRGFLDGAAISKCKKDYGIDVLIPIRRNMDIYEDATRLFELSETEWVDFSPPKVEPKKPPRPRPKAVEKREQKRRETIEKRQGEKPAPPPEKVHVKTEVSSIQGFTIWSSCTVPLTVVANREHYADGHHEEWFLIDTQEQVSPQRSRQDYLLRSSKEERYRQLKCFCDLTNFTSRKFSLVVNQVVFIMVAYNLLQLFLLRKHRKELTRKTPPKIRQQLLPAHHYIIVYWQNYYGLFTTYEYTEIIALLSEEARMKIAHKSRRLRRELEQSMNNPRPP